MGVDDYVQAGIVSEVHNLIDPVQPGFVDFVFRCGADHLQPGNRDADTGEAGPFQVCERRLGGLAARLPDSLVRIALLFAGPGSVVIAVEMIAHVPAQAQFCGHLPGIGIAARRGRRRIRGRFPFLGDGHLHGGNAGGHEGHFGGPDHRRLIGFHLESHGHLVILVRAVLIGDPVRTSGQDRTGRGRDVQGDGLPCLGNIKGSLAYRHGCRSDRSRVHRVILFTAGKNRQQGCEKGDVSFHHFKEGICSRVRTRLEDIRLLQYASVFRL